MIEDVVILKQIISESERNELLEWMDKNSEFFVKPTHPGSIRLSTRFTNKFTKLDISYPLIAETIRSRIAERLNIKNYGIPCRENGGFDNGIVAALCMEGDQCELHTDPIYIEGTNTYHCIILLAKAEGGGIPIVNQVEYDIDELDGMFYNVCKMPHETTKITGSKIRKIWIFGFCV